MAGQPFFYQGNIDRFEGDKAVIRLIDGQELFWLRKHLSAEAKEGSSIRFFIELSPSDEKKACKRVKRLLKQISAN